jgi:hypothetical protein
VDGFRAAPLEQLDVAVEIQNAPSRVSGSEGDQRMTGMAQMTQTSGGNSSGSLYKVVELILDRGLVIDLSEVGVTTKRREG